MRSMSGIVFVLSFAFIAVSDDATRPLTPSEALTKIDQKVTVLMEVKSTGGNTARYLNSEADFRADKNFAIFIPNIALSAFQKANIADPGKHYYGKTILVSGTVAVVQNRPQIRVEDPTQIKIVNGNAATGSATKRAAK